MMAKLSIIKAIPNYAMWFLRGLRRTETLTEASPSTPPPQNDFQRYFDGIRSGPGIWKWTHYFEIYDRHFAQFKNKPVNVLEIGIYSGGSLEMWKNYFGAGCAVYGVDIEESCRAYEGQGVRVFIGDQADRNFWRQFKQNAPMIDIVIDDGGHLPLQQRTSFEELFPHLKPGGIYLCEDIHGQTQSFAAYVCGLSSQLHAQIDPKEDLTNDERRISVKTSPLQCAVHSIHVYPFIAVIEKRPAPVTEFIAPKHGTQWQPFLR
jgi:SAM-dependent methyltransferase